MAKSRFERSSGFGPMGLLFLAVVVYVILSVSLGIATRDDTQCRAGYHREWRFAPPGWVCD